MLNFPKPKESVAATSVTDRGVRIAQLSVAGQLTPARSATRMEKSIARRTAAILNF